MMQIRHADDRGHYQIDWLNSWHSFSFGEYHDPKHMGLSNLRVINDDIVAPGGGFATHGHNDMEIVTYVLEGALKHQDSMGNGSVIHPGDVQRMSAGSGVMHSEHNASDDESVRLLQIWLLPNRKGIAPAYQQQHFPVEERRGRLRLLVSPDGRDNSIMAHQDALLYGTLLGKGESVHHMPLLGGSMYVQVARGSVQINGLSLGEGDAVTLMEETGIQITGASEIADVLLFDLP
ncbi:MAG: pirin family protein [Gammaproteobacteria bacterium]|nr:pirin family protein [Gammaproteobacteria bacterium]